MHDPIDGPATPDRPGLLDPAFMILAGVMLAGVLCGLWMWTMVEVSRCPAQRHERPRPVMVG